MRDMERDRVTVAEAAKRLGISESAIRKRVFRDQIDHDRDEGGKLYVYLSSRDRVGDTVQDEVQDRYIDSLENQIRFLRDELQRKDAILLNMTEAMKALNPPASDAPSEAPESPERPGPSATPPAQSGGPETPTEATDQQQGRGPIPDAGGPQEATERRWWEFWR